MPKTSLTGQSEPPTRRWTPMRHHPEQWRLWNSPARFRVIPAGRRSGKTEVAKRWVVQRACNLRVQGRKYVFAAPTRDQAKRIYWADLKAMVPAHWVHAVRETELEVQLVNGTRLCVVGMDRPERIEGEPLHGIVLDEYGNMKPEAWTENVSPALDTPNQPPGWAWFVGVPEGRNHYWDLWTEAAQLKAGGQSWDRFHWHSADILSAEAVEAARQRMDDRTFRQELEGSFESYAGLAYYAWSDDNIVAGLADNYDADADLIMCFDFNVSPGTAVICQEYGRNISVHESADQDVTAVIGEVWIPEHSNTPMVCDRLVADWGYHRGKVLIYGDASGGARTTVAVAGSDWDIIRRKMRSHFGDRLSMRNRKANPRERARLNAVNSRIGTTDGKRRLFVDPVEAPHVVNDFQRVETVPGGTGEILKPTGSELTHLTDGLGYYVHDRFPVVDGKLISKRIV